MKKIVKRLILSIVVFILLSAFALYVFVAFFAPLDLIKDYVSSKLEAQLGLPVAIEDISSDIFSGIKIKGVKAVNPPGFSEKPLLYVKNINLKYNLWAILKGELAINKIEIVSPSVWIEKNAEGKLNLPKKAKKHPPAPQKSGTSKDKKKSPLNLFISSFSLKGGEVFYLDKSQAKPKKFGAKNLKADVSGILLSMLKPIRASASGLVLLDKKEIPLSFSSKVAVDLKTKKIKAKELTLKIGGEKLSGLVTVEMPSSGISADFYLACEKLSVENLLGIFGIGATATVKEETTGTATEEAAPPKTLALSVPTNIKVHGVLSLNNLYYRKMRIPETKAEIDLKKGRLYLKVEVPKAYRGTFALNGAVLLNQPDLGYQIKGLYLKNFDASAFSKDVIDSFLPNLADKKEWQEKFHGKFSVSVTGAGGGIGVKEILQRSRLQGFLTLKDGKFVHLKSLEEIAAALKTPALAQDLAVKEFSADFKVYNGILTLSNTSLEDTDVRARFKGSADLINQQWLKGNVLTLVFSQPLSAQLSEEYSLLKNSRGEAEVELELTGALKKPVPVPKLDKAAQRALEKVAPQVLDQIKGRLKELLPINF